PSTIRLKDIANVVWGTKERETIIRINGDEAVEIEIYKEGDANTVNVCNLVKDLLGIERKRSLSEIIEEKISLGLQPVARDSEGKHELSETPSTRRELIKKRNILSSLPQDVQIHIISDQSQFIISSIEEVQNSAINGGILALLVLFLFLRDIKSTITIGFAIPISVIATFLPMFIRGVSLNIMSLGGIALGIGMLVDNSIVVLESIFRCKEEGDAVRTSALRGTYEVSSAVIASTLTTVAVFFPVSFVEGIAGQLFRDLSLTVTFSLLASLLVALFLNPLFVSNTFTLTGQSQRVILPLRVFKFYKEIKHEKFLSSFGKSICFLVIRYIRNAQMELRNIFTFKKTPSIFTSPLTFFDVSLKLISWILNTVILYPLVVIACLSLSPILVMCWLVMKIFTSLSKMLLYIPLNLFSILFEGFKNLYKYSLKRSLPYAPFFLILIFILFIYTLLLLPRLGQELIPTLKQGEFNILYETKAGTKLEQTLEKTKRIEQILKAHPLVETITLQIGSESSKSESKGRNENKATFTVLLKNRKETTQIQESIIEELRTKIIPFPEENIIFTLPSLFSLKTNLEVQIFGDDLDMLMKVGEKCLENIRKIRGIKDAELSIQPGYPEIVIQFDTELLSAKGLTPIEVANKLRREIQGEIATKFNRGGDKIDIRVRTDQIYLKNLEDLRQLPISNGTPTIRLCDIATIKESVGPSDIRRIGQKRAGIITANIQGRDLGSVSEEVMENLRSIEKPREFFITLGGQNRELATSYQSLRFALFLAIFLVYVVMASQFESIWLPFLVMFSVPLAFIGVIIVLYLTNTSLSVTVFLGSIVLAGIVVNNAIVLIDYTNQLLKRGLSLGDAIVTASSVRLRPILMTTLTTVLGLLPMLTSKGEGSELRYPLALTIVTGLTSSTLLTLWIIPMANYMFSSMSKAIRK
ncbi:MAG: efflux RND transporter permease subunit, partial [Candidatus Hydrogenedentes bacterium]|nr:efflux RND transporter permease subunit [Candidatus Hydrogenedentota bacterium]